MITPLIIQGNMGICTENINKRAPPPQIRDLNNNTTDHMRKYGGYVLIWEQIINKRAPPPPIRDHPLF